MPRSLSSPPFLLLLGATALGFGGYALLLPVVPLWVARGGSGEFGAGLTTGVLMAVTVGTQLLVPAMLRRVGHRPVLVVGSLLLGLPTPLLALTADLAPVLAVSAVRGVGFGMATVAGSALVAELVEPSAHGRASARYGYAVGLPQLALLPAGVAVVDAIGFTGVFVAAGLAPVGGALVIAFVRGPAVAGRARTGPGAGGDRRTGSGPGGAGHAPEVPGPGVAGYTRRSPFAGATGHPRDGRRRLPAAPVLAMLVCSTAQGGVITFAPLAAPGSGLAVPAALFATALGALVGRGVAGARTDRSGRPGALLPIGTLVAAAGMTGVLAAPVGAAFLMVGAAAVGAGFGLVQNDAMVTLFAAAGPLHYGAASAAWNIAYDAGTGLGASGLGAIAEPFGFAAAFGAAAAALLIATPFVRHRRRAP
ncbi:putative transport protein [Pseudonocardia sp. Ae168_Ps1]|uniref:MFS transporter n=1 Tax=unclassified Pseudonocardia TaxID=2619320 RepID=UPI00094B257E|nr:MULTISPECIES: MFS transporter [unclassified Pseudonocardia]OLL75488.1 putative transport protein [Pseudonocardia sp. Ae150A_Ps1]OLL81483.1 putative transport protein [Pseudonocardia sp. Ae168_Ps1]OLL84404.1 putative transport protein [Pseudonocardia sp. Ae263_Ps1]OLL95578.1 putative transport protein [Pseudonocardia sp. Ae356_Ps1]